MSIIFKIGNLQNPASGSLFQIGLRIYVIFAGFNRSEPALLAKNHSNL
jgi:hypothetical protein